MKRIRSWTVCAVASILPWRLRVMFANLLGWWAQALYGLIYFLTRTIVKALNKKDAKS